MALTKKDRKVIEGAVDDAHITSATMRYGADKGVEVTTEMLRKAADLIDGLCDMMTGIVKETS